MCVHGAGVYVCIVCTVHGSVCVHSASVCVYVFVHSMGCVHSAGMCMCAHSCRCVCAQCRGVCAQCRVCMCTVQVCVCMYLYMHVENTGRH